MIFFFAQFILIHPVYDMRPDKLLVSFRNVKSDYPSFFLRIWFRGGNFLKKIAPRSRGSIPFGGQFSMVGGQFLNYEKIGKKKNYKM